MFFTNGREERAHTDRQGSRHTHIVSQLECYSKYSSNLLQLLKTNMFMSINQIATTVSYKQLQQQSPTLRS